MIALALVLTLTGPPEPAARPLVIFVEHFGSDLSAEHAGLALAAACRSRPVTILARRRGRLDRLTPGGAVVASLPRANFYAALAGAFEDAGKGGDVVYVGPPISALAGLQSASDDALAALRRSGATFHGVSFTALPNDRMRLLAEKSGGDVWIATGASLPAAAPERLCR